ncbi:MAG: VWA domain-containing protein [Kiritimatiellae bacterium]|nr:VWA domain-containing protein [Kiritimatiellia bacterium]
MTLAHPHILWLILLVPVLLFFRYRPRRHPGITFSDGTVLDRLPPSWAVLAQPVLPILYTVGLVLLIVALARPQKGLDESRVRTEAVDIVLLVDVSTSMRAEDFSTPTRRVNRLDAAKAVIEKFIRDRRNDRIGMVAFSAMPYTVAPLTLDHGWLIQRMNDVETGMLEDGTAIGDAIASAVNRLRESKAKSKVVILLTDGMQNAGTLSPDNAAQAAKALDIKIYAVGAGTTGLVPIPVTDPFGGTRYVRQRSEIDESMLKRISTMTGAAYFRATDLNGLEDVYAQIDEMEKTEIEIEKFTRFEEKFMAWVVLAMACLSLEKFLALTRLGRLP